MRIKTIQPDTQASATRTNKKLFSVMTPYAYYIYIIFDDMYIKINEGIHLAKFWNSNFHYWINNL